jgi:AraC-like DNA-binding protein
VPESVTSFFTEPADFAAALAKEYCSGLVITGHGEFRARLTWVRLHLLRLLAVGESLSRIAFVSVPEQRILVALPCGSGSRPIWGGINMQADQIMTFGPGSLVSMRTDGSCRWAVLLVPAADLARFGYAMVGETFAVPMGTRRWRPPQAAGKCLRRLHAAAIAAVEGGHAEFIGREAAHGLDQQIVEALVECLSVGSIAEEKAVTRRDQETMIRFEALLTKRNANSPGLAEIGRVLGVSRRVLRRCCLMHLGMSPASYLHLRSMQFARVHCKPETAAWRASDKR